ncbi:MAG: c-type cytochrome [Chitinophagaceae bacterium]|nr:c-type cytochrome [Chitinophagaceae bacterium]
MSKNILKTIFLILCPVALFSYVIPQEDVFKNLKVFPKNISSEALHKYMDDFNEGLGVKCNYCHAKNEEGTQLDFASDDKPEKEMGRIMIKLTMEINQKYFNYRGDSTAEWRVTCNTCHRGNPIPSLQDTLIKK